VEGGVIGIVPEGVVHEVRHLEKLQSDHEYKSTQRGGERRAFPLGQKRVLHTAWKGKKERRPNVKDRE